MKHKDNFTDLVENLPKDKPEETSSGPHQVTNDDNEVITLGQQAVENFLQDRKNKGN